MKIGDYTVAIPGQPTIMVDQPVYTVMFLQDCEIGGSKFRTGQIIQALAPGVFSAKGLAQVYDWSRDAFVDIADTLPRLPT